MDEHPKGQGAPPFPSRAQALGFRPEPRPQAHEESPFDEQREGTGRDQRSLLPPHPPIFSFSFPSPLVST